MTQLKSEGFSSELMKFLNLQPKLEKQTFTIGDNKEYKSQGLYVKSAVNRALVLGERYQVTLLAVNRWGDNTSISSVKLEKTILSGYGPQDSGSVGIVAAWVILVLLLIAIPFVIFFIIKRYVNSELSHANNKWHHGK